MRLFTRQQQLEGIDIQAMLSRPGTASAALRRTAAQGTPATPHPPPTSLDALVPLVPDLPTVTPVPPASGRKVQQMQPVQPASPAPLAAVAEPKSAPAYVPPQIHELFLSLDGFSQISTRK